MKIRLTEHLVQHLSKLGQAIDIDRQFQVFDDGVVGIVNDQSEKEDESERQGTRGSATGSRQGSSGPRRTASEARARLGRLDPQVVQLAGLEDLWRAYPTKIIEGDHGLWIIIKSNPLGHDGPQVTFILAYPYSTEIEPKAWALWKLGDFPKFVGERHCNFPDQSVCAYGPNDNAWERSDGLLPLVDLYSTWIVRQLYLMHFGRWPGRQHGLTALYRRTEFSADEWCGCGSGKRYGECHLAADALLSDDEARAEHQNVMGSEYGPRKPPKSIMRFARSGFKKVPTFRDAFESR
jgi:hypothetical protein